MAVRRFPTILIKSTDIVDFVKQKIPPWPAREVGQISMLRRLAGAPVRAENFFKAEIVTGRAGAEQAAPKMDFD